MFEDDKSLSLGGDTLDAADPVSVEYKGMSRKYTLASNSLQILDPPQGLMSHRNACKKRSVDDHVKRLWTNRLWLDFIVVIKRNPMWQDQRLLVLQKNHRPNGMMIADLGRHHRKDKDRQGEA